MSSVFCISGSLSFSPTTRRCRFCSMNWYLLRRQAMCQRTCSVFDQSFLLPEQIHQTTHAIISWKLLSVGSTSSRDET